MMNQMPKGVFKFRKNNAVFVSTVSDTVLKVVKFNIGKSSKRNFSALEVEALPRGTTIDKGLCEKLGKILKKLDYNNHPFIISLPRNLATSRYLTLPAQSLAEIENISSLQAPRYLPYPANELITGCQVISQNKNGYSQVNLVIVYKEVVNRYLNCFKILNIKNFSIILSSYGLGNFYNYLNPQETKRVMLVDIDLQQAEAAVIVHKKLIFSRYFKINRQLEGWEKLFGEEIQKTSDAYAREFPQEPVEKIALMGAEINFKESEKIIREQMELPIEVLYQELNKGKFDIPIPSLSKVVNSDYSFASLFGLALTQADTSLELLPEELKGKIRQAAHHRQYLRIFFLAVTVILLWFLAMAKNLDNKAKYLDRLKEEVGKIAQQARPLEEIDRRYKILESQGVKRAGCLDFLYELSQLMPAQVSLTNLNYEDDKELVVRGQSSELNPVFSLVSELEKSAVFKNFSVKVRYATKKKTATGEVVNFEIGCVKR